MKTKISRRSFIRSAALGLGALSLAGCGNDSQNQAAGDKTDKITLVLDYVPNTNHTGIYVAQAKGYYKEKGIELEIQQPPEDGADALVASGRAQFGIGYQGFMANYLASDNPLPVLAVAAILQHNTSGIMSAKDTNITRFRDMEHHSYASWNSPQELATLKYCVQKDGGNWDEVEIVPCNSTDEVSSLRAHEFDSIWVFEGWACQNAKLQDFKYNYLSFVDFDDVFDEYTPVLISSTHYLEDNSEQAKKFIEATRQGYEYAAAHPDEAAQILCDQVPELDPALIKLSQKFLSAQYVADAKSWGIIDPARWNRYYKWMYEQDIIPQEIGADVGFTMEYLD